jgi:Esterase-like activity of phytase
VSDEYGPFVTHFDATGKQIGRYSPFDATLPHELANRVPNRGMEGLTITPDGTTLVAMMQSALQQPDIGSLNAKKIAPLRITTIKLATGELHEYLYLLDNPGTTSTAVSEIAALTDTTFLVDERDGSFPPGAYKKLWQIDLAGATDVGPGSTVPGAVYDPNAGGLLLTGKTIEDTVGTSGTSAAQSTLGAAGITVVSKSLFLDLGHLLDTIDPSGKFFSHDKIEGVAVLNGGNNIVLANDSDFGIDGVTNAGPPYQLHAKLTTAGVQDDGEFLAIDMTQLGSQAAVPETPFVPLLIALPVIGLALYLAIRRLRKRGSTAA